MEGRLFGDVPMNLELRLSVEDSPNSAGVAIDAVRCCKLALERGKGGALYSPSAYFMKHPPKQFSDDIAFRMTEEFIAGQDIEGENIVEEKRAKSSHATSGPLVPSRGIK
jgi:myo-inositol-1-phosphate synthase